MDQLTALRTFVVVADKTSFAEAARALRISPTAVSRAVSELEERLGVLLFRRTTRAVSLTPEGAAYLPRARSALDELDEAARDLRGESAEPRGNLAITAPVEFGRMHVMPIALGLMQRHPALNINLLLVDRIVRIAEEGIDAALRIGDLPDSALHAIRLSEVRRVLVASPEYLEKRGTPSSLEDLDNHDLVAFDNFTLNGEWLFGAVGTSYSVGKPRLLVDDIRSTVDAAISGLGISRLLTYQVENEIQSGKLVYVLPELDPPPVPISLVFQANRAGSANLRTFAEAARIHFKGTRENSDG